MDIIVGNVALGFGLGMLVAVAGFIPLDRNDFYSIPFWVTYSAIL